MITSASLSASHRPGLMPRLVQSCAADLRGYAAGVGRDLQALSVHTAAGIITVAVLLSQLFDLLTTALDMAGNLTEANPINAAVIARFGLGGLLAEKLAIAATVIFNMARLRGRSALLLGLGATAVGLAAAAWNLHLIW